MRLMEKTAAEGGGRELMAATALAGLATGLQPSGFEAAPARLKDVDVKAN